MQIIIINKLFLSDVPSKFSKILCKELTIANPQYLENRKYGRWNGKTPKKLHFYEEEGDSLILPRGYIDQLILLCKKHNISFSLVDKTRILPEVDFNFIGKLKDLQENAADDMLNFDFGTLSAPTGCLSGDSLININRAKYGKPVSIEHLYLKYHGNPSQTMGPNLNKNIPTFVRAYNKDKDKIRLHKIKDVVYSGKKPCYLLTLQNGKTIKATPSHLIQTAKGWKKLILLIPNIDEIMVDTLLPKKSNKNKKKYSDKNVGGLWYHPFARKFKSNSYARGWDKDIEYHRAVYEAHINNLTLDEYKKILKYEKEKAKKLNFVNIKENEIHHKDENHNNNVPENLTEMKISEHKKLHSDYSLFGQGTPKFSKVKSINFSGIEDTYDIICEDPYRNFVANEIVVHNSGKTVIALYLIAKTKQPALIIIHTTDLLFQWARRIETFLGIPEKDIGIIGAGQKKIGEKITVALVQSLYKCADKISKHIGHLIVDECHRIPSRTFTEAAIAFDCRYMLGLSATAYRRDNLSKLIFLSLGDMRHEINKQSLIENGSILKPEIITRRTNFRSISDPVNEYSKMISELIENEERNHLICSDISFEVDRNNICLVLSDRKEHCKIIHQILSSKFGIEAELLTGDIPHDERQAITKALNERQIKVLVATGQLIGEGFDCKVLSVLFLATPVRFSGRIIQYVGRILRPAKGKEKAILYDYVDIEIKVLRASAQARRKALAT
jgi:superfamily II DNA or RNA helicase